MFFISKIAVVFYPATLGLIQSLGYFPAHLTVESEYIRIRNARCHSYITQRGLGMSCYIRSYSDERYY